MRTAITKMGALPAPLDPARSTFMATGASPDRAELSELAAHRPALPARPFIPVGAAKGGSGPWQPAVVAALLTANPLAATAADDAPATPGSAAAKPPATPTAAKPAASSPGAAKPAGAPPQGAAKPAGASPQGAAKPAGAPPQGAAKAAGASPQGAAKPAGSPPPGATNPAAPPPPGAAKPAGASPQGAAKPAGSLPPGATKPAGSPAPGAAKPAGPALTSSAPAATPAAGAAVAADPAKAHLPLAQATFGIKGVGALFATIEIAELGKPVVALHCELYADKAPLAVANFVGLARGLRPWKDPKLGQWVKRPLYDGNQLHRVIPELLLQGGDPSCSVDGNCRGAAGVGDPGYSIPDEIRPELRFDRAGRLAMANHGPETGGSQFFITEREAPWLTGSNTIFGQCDGAELVTQLTHVETGPRDQPKTPLTIKHVTFIRKPR